MTQLNDLPWTAIALAVGLAGCGGSETKTAAQDTPPATADAATVPASGTGMAPARAVAALRKADGTTAGTATATPAGDGVMVALRVEGLPPGAHGVHVHMTGKCDAPTFESAGGHWNPASAKHGLENPQGQHAGDMPNLTVGQDGRGTLEYTLKGGALDGLLDADGAAMMVHASADDQKTDPSGDSGSRIACGVFASG
jgi:Cu-Zn family superoxide dismutase